MRGSTVCSQENNGPFDDSSVEIATSRETQGVAFIKKTTLGDLGKVVCLYFTITMSFCLGTVGITKEKGTNPTHGCRVLVATTGIENGTGIDGLKIKLGNSMYLPYLFNQSSIIG